MSQLVIEGSFHSNTTMTLRERNKTSGTMFMWVGSTYERTVHTDFDKDAAIEVIEHIKREFEL